MIKGLVFDFDGTLANTLPVIFACYDYSTEKVLGKKRTGRLLLKRLASLFIFVSPAFSVKKKEVKFVMSTELIRRFITMN